MVNDTISNPHNNSYLFSEKFSTENPEQAIVQLYDIDGLSP